MKVFKNMKISLKLIITFSILVFLFAIAMATAMIGLGSMSNNTEELYGRDYQIEKICSGMQLDIQDMEKNLSLCCSNALNTENLGAAGAAEKLNENIASVQNSLANLKDRMDQLDSYNIEDKTTLNVLTENFPVLQSVADEILGNYDSGKITDGMQLSSDQMDPVATRIGKSIDRLAENAEARAALKYEDSAKLFSTIQIIFYILCAVLLAASVTLCINLTHSITHPLNVMETMAKQLAEGNLKQDISYKSENEFGILAQSMRDTVATLNTYIEETRSCIANIGQGKLNCKSEIEFKGDFAQIKQFLDDISDNLTKTMKQINVSADQVTSGAGQIAASAQSLSQSTLEQASSVEELSATINDISDRVRENADNAEASSRLAKSVGDDVADSGNQVESLSALMDEMKEMSGKITGIIGEIEDIAFQTNILSLNAAVEAARAGEAGRGFSVVANEIRRLSAKTTDASKSTGELINKTVELMSRGADMTDKTSEKLHLVVKSARDAADKVHAISLASNEQATAVVQLRESIGQISSVVQENSATAEESAASSEELNGQMRMLKDLVDSFEFDRDDSEKDGN